MTISSPISPNNIGKDGGPKCEKLSTNGATDCNSDFSTCKPLPSLLSIIVFAFYWEKEECKTLPSNVTICKNLIRCLSTLQVNH